MHLLTGSAVRRVLAGAGVVVISLALAMPASARDEFVDVWAWTSIDIHKTADRNSDVVDQITGPIEAFALCQEQGGTVETDWYQPYERKSIDYVNDWWTYLPDYGGYINDVWLASTTGNNTADPTPSDLTCDGL